jgi:multiple sugar transport system permease protein
LATVARTAAPGSRRRARRFASFRERETWTAYLFILPWVIGFLALTAGPMFYSLYLSFTNYGVEQIGGFAATERIGLDNYRQLFADDEKVVKSLMNTFIFTVMMVPAKMAIALALAMILAYITRFGDFFRTVFYLPDITPPVAVGILLLLLFNGATGIVNRALDPLLGLFGVSAPFWTTDPNWIKPGLAIMSVWAVGGTMVIYLAAIKGVPQHLYEAAAMDGAGPWRRFRDVTLPMISPALFFTFIILTIAGLQTFTEVYTAFFGSSAAGAEQPEAALMNVVYLFRQAFEFFNMGFASAMAWLLFVIIMIVTAIQFFVSRRFVFYQGAERG